MAWQDSTGKHQHRKEAAAAKRAQRNRIAISEADPGLDCRGLRKRRPKKLGLKLYHWSMFKKREDHFTEWYSTDRDREQALAKFEKETFLNKPRFSKIELVTR